MRDGVSLNAFLEHNRLDELQLFAICILPKGGASCRWKVNRGSIFTSSAVHANETITFIVTLPIQIAYMIVLHRYEENICVVWSDVQWITY